MRSPRDTLDEVRDVARDLRSLDERLTGRLNTGADTFTTFRARLEAAEATAKAANAAAVAATAPRPIPWVRVVPIALALLGMFAGVVGTMARTPSAADVEARAAELSDRIRALESAINEVEKRSIALGAALESTRDLAARRLDALEQRAAAAQRGANGRQTR